MNITDEKRRERLILQMGSPDNGFAVEAARQLEMRGWLSDKSLKGAFLREANLKGARLYGAYLSEVDLSWSDLSSASLCGAKMERSILHGADLYKADLQRVQFRSAILCGARFEGALLQQACLDGADLSGSTITNKQLSQVASLDGTIMPDGIEYNPETHKEISTLRDEDYIEKMNHLVNSIGE